jgi:hypothetical protein
MVDPRRKGTNDDADCIEIARHLLRRRKCRQHRGGEQREDGSQLDDGRPGARTYFFKAIPPVSDP